MFVLNRSNNNVYKSIAGLVHPNAFTTVPVYNISIIKLRVTDGV